MTASVTLRVRGVIEVLFVEEAGSVREGTRAVG